VLVLPQQKAWARGLIRQQPDTPMAKAAQQLLDEYRCFDALREAERRQADAYARGIRADWRSRRVPRLTAQRRVVRLRNRAGRAVPYQIKGPSMAWSGPYRLRDGQTHEVRYMATIRFWDGTRFVVRSVTPGYEYTFRSETAGRTLQMKRTPPRSSQQAK